MPDSRLILFDIDQTLIYTAGAGMRSLARALTEVLDIDRACLEVKPAGKTDPQILRETLQKAGRHDVVGPLEDAVWARYAWHLEQEMSRPDPRREIKAGVVPLIEALHARPGFCLGLLTGNLQATARIKLEPFGLNRYFPVGGFGSDNADRRQLGAVALQRARTHYEKAFPPQLVWVVGDTDRDIEAARALDPAVRVLAVATGHQSVEQLQAFNPDAALPDLSDTESVLSMLSSEHP